MVLDNLSSGRLANLRRNEGNPRFSFVKRDLKLGLVPSLSDFEAVYHLAANSEVRSGATNPGAQFSENVVSTFRLLEAVRRWGGTRLLVFASTSTVYGEAKRLPTPEDYGPLKPISTYGGSKLACEALVSAYASTYGFRAVIYRLANVVGPRSGHGIIYDLINKLKSNSRQLEILGDGNQKKSYLHVRDCVSGMTVGAERSVNQVSVLNIGAADQIRVKRIAEIICQEMELKDVELRFRDLVGDGRGWVGDVRNMMLDTSKLRRLGWVPSMNSEAAIRNAARDRILEAGAATTRGRISEGRRGLRA